MWYSYKAPGTFSARQVKPKASSPVTIRAGGGGGTGGLAALPTWVGIWGDDANHVITGSPFWESPHTTSALAMPLENAD